MRLPTLDLFGRGELSRMCGQCDAPITNCDIGRLPVVHIAVLHAVGNATTQTRLNSVGGRLEYIHTCGLLDVANTKSASSHSFLKNLDKIFIRGDDDSFRRLRTKLPGLIGVFERGLGIDVRHLTRIPVGIIECSSNQLRQPATAAGASAVMWVSALRHVFSHVVILRGTSTGPSE
jgi:hypothetical protein